MFELNVLMFGCSLAHMLSSLEAGFASMDWWKDVKAQILFMQYLAEVLDNKVTELPSKSILKLLLILGLIMLKQWNM